MASRSCAASSLGMPSTGWVLVRRPRRPSPKGPFRRRSRERPRAARNRPRRHCPWACRWPAPILRGRSDIENPRSDTRALVRCTGPGGADPRPAAARLREVVPEQGLRTLGGARAARREPRVPAARGQPSRLALRPPGPLRTPHALPRGAPGAARLPVGVPDRGDLHRHTRRPAGLRHVRRAGRAGGRPGAGAH